MIVKWGCGFSDWMRVGGTLVLAVFQAPGGSGVDAIAADYSALLSPCWTLETVSVFSRIGHASKRPRLWRDSGGVATLLLRYFAGVESDSVS